MNNDIPDNKILLEAWHNTEDGLRALLPRAVQVLSDGLDSDDPKIQLASAIHILKAVGLYGQYLEPNFLSNFR